jgi:hypothetical protein
LRVVFARPFLPAAGRFDFLWALFPVATGEV